MALLGLAPGAGANATIFSFVDAMLLRPLAYPQPDRLVVPISTDPTRGIGRGASTDADDEEWRNERSVVERP